MALGCSAALGVCAALWERERRGRGQVIVAAMSDGVELLIASLWEKRSNGHWPDENGAKTSTRMPSTTTYTRHPTVRGMAVGSREPVFFARLLECLELPKELRTASSTGENLRSRIAERFRTRN